MDGLLEVKSEPKWKFLLRAVHATWVSMLCPCTIGIVCALTSRYAINTAPRGAVNKVDCAAEYVQVYRMRNQIDKLSRPNALLLLCFPASHTISNTYGTAAFTF